MSQPDSDVQAVFKEALEQAPGAPRAAYLDEACAGDDELRRRVEALLLAHEPTDQPSDPVRTSMEGGPLGEATAEVARGLVPDTTQAVEEATREFVPKTDGAEGPDEDGEGDGDGLARGAVVRYFGDYEIHDQLGRGGMGVVYRARQVSLNRPVALKMLRSGLLADDDELRRFQNEAEAVALLDHPGVVPVYEVGEHDGQRYLSMKLVSGGNLADRLDAYRGDRRAAAALTAEAAEAVHHAHVRGILHRDLKPANILVDDEGRPHVTDFGLAKRVGGDVELTQSGAILGTPGYMSPEQAAGRRAAITTAADVYGLGSVLYAVLTGRAPFVGDSLADVLQQVREQPPESPRRISEGVPRDLEVICLKCLEKDPKRRYASAQAMADDLRAWLDSRPIAARPVGPATRLRLWARRRPAVAGLSAAVVVVSLAGLAFGAWQWRAALDNAATADRNAATATANEQLARANARQAQERSAELAASNLSLRRATYASTMRLAQREWDRGDVGLARKLLDSQSPEPGEADLRGFDWGFLRRQCDASLLTIATPGMSSPAVPRAVSFSADGRRLSVTLDNAVAVHDATTGRELYRSAGKPFLDAGFSPCGRYLATLNLDGGPRADLGWNQNPTPVTLAILDATTYQPLRTTTVAPGFLGLLRFSPDGDRLVVTSMTLAPEGWHSTLTLCDAAAGAVIRTLYDGDGLDTRPAFSPDGKLVATETGYHAVSAWDAATGRPAWSIADESAGLIRGIAFHPDGKRLATIGDDGRAKIWDLATGRPILSLRIADQNGSGVQYSPDGLHLITVDSEKIARIWDAETGEFLFLIRGVDHRLSFSPDGARIASYGANETVRVWDAASEAQAAVAGPIADSIYALAVSPDGEAFATGDGSVWDARALTRRYLVEPPDGASWRGVAFSPDGRRLVFGGGRPAPPGEPKVAGTIRMVEPGSGLESASITEPRGAVGVLECSPDGRWLATASGLVYGGEAWATLRDASTGKAVRDLADYHEGQFNVAFRPDSRAIAYGGGDAVLVRGVEDGAEILTIRGLGGVPLSIAFSPDGRRLLAEIRRPDHTEEIRIWDAEDGRRTLAIDVPRFTDVTRVVFSPDGKRLATADFRALVKIWDAASGQDLLTLKGHTSWVWSLAFSPDGARLYSGGRDQTVRVWRADPPAEAPQPEPPGLSIDPSRLFTQAVALGQSKRYAQAEPLWRRFLEINRRRNLDDEPAMIGAESRLGECLARLGRYVEAEPLLLRSYDRARAHPMLAQTPGQSALFRERIVAFYELTGQPDRAATWRDRELDETFPNDPFAP